MHCLSIGRVWCEFLVYVGYHNSYKWQKYDTGSCEEVEVGVPLQGTNIPARTVVSVKPKHMPYDQIVKS